MQCYCHLCDISCLTSRHSWRDFSFSHPSSKEGVFLCPKTRTSILLSFFCHRAEILCSQKKRRKKKGTHAQCPSSFSSLIFVPSALSFLSEKGKRKKNTVSSFSIAQEGKKKGCFLPRGILPLLRHHLRSFLFPKKKERFSSSSK